MFDLIVGTSTDKVSTMSVLIHPLLMLICTLLLKGGIISLALVMSDHSLAEITQFFLRTSEQTFSRTTAGRI